MCQLPAGEKEGAPTTILRISRQVVSDLIPVNPSWFRIFVQHGLNSESDQKGPLVAFGGAQPTDAARYSSTRSIKSSIIWPISKSFGV
jgi:hypothetical protein